MHPALHRDVRVGNTRSEQLAQGAHVKRILGSDPPLLLEEVLHLLEHGVLQDGVYDEHQGWGHAGEQAQGSLLANQREQRGERGGRFGGRGAGQHGLVRLVLARRHARVDDPDGVREEDGGRAGDGACHHRFDGGELHAGAAGLEGGLLEEGAGPFVPCVHMSVVLKRRRHNACAYSSSRRSS